MGMESMQVCSTLARVEELKARKSELMIYHGYPMKPQQLVGQSNSEAGS
jgi:hypothetical protein